MESTILLWLLNVTGIVLIGTMVYITYKFRVK